jgi:hypothetical protein
MGPEQREWEKNVSDEHIASLEQQLQSLAHDLAQTRRQVQALQGAARRGRLARALAATGAASALMLALGLTSASSAPSSASGLTVKGPFKVLGANGSTILQVDGNGLTFFAGSGGTVTLNTYKGLPYISVRHGGINGPDVVSIGDSTVGGGGGSVQLGPDSGDQAVGVGLRANSTTGSVVVYAQNAQGRLQAQQGSPMSLQFSGTNNKVALGIGIASPGGPGAMTLHDGNGHVLVNLGASSTGGAIDVKNSSGTNVASLGVSSTGGALDIEGNSSQLAAQLAAHSQAGYLAIVSGDNAKVEAGVTGGVGIVRAFGPGGFNVIQGREGGN